MQWTQVAFHVGFNVLFICLLRLGYRGRYPAYYGSLWDHASVGERFHQARQG